MIYIDVILIFSLGIIATIIKIPSPLVSPFITVALANIIVDQVTKYKENKAHMHLALCTISSMYDDFLRKRRSLYESIDEIHHVFPDAPIWVLAKPLILSDLNLKFNFNDLDFLLINKQKEGYNIFQDLVHLENTHRRFCEVVKRFNTLSEENQIHIDEFRKENPNFLGEDFDFFNQIQSSYGRRNLKITEDSILEILMHSEHLYTDASRDISNYLIKYARYDSDKVKTYDIQHNCKLENLPTLPKIIRQRILDQKRRDMK